MYLYDDFYVTHQEHNYYYYSQDGVGILGTKESYYLDLENNNNNNNVDH